MASMNEINLNNNINPYNSFANLQGSNPSGPNTGNRYSSNSGELTDIKSGSASERDLMPLIN